MLLNSLIVNSMFPKLLLGNMLSKVLPLCLSLTKEWVLLELSSITDNGGVHKALLASQRNYRQTKAAGSGIHITLRHIYWYIDPVQVNN